MVGGFLPLGWLHLYYGEKAQKRGGKAPRHPTTPPRPASPLSSEEITDDDVRGLIARVNALEREREERAAGRGDGGSASNSQEIPPPCTFTRRGSGAQFFACCLLGCLH